MPMNPRLLRPRASGYVAPDADARAYISAVQTADGSELEPAVAKAINDFVAACKTDGIWSAIKASCILMGARTLSGALTPLVGSAPTNNNFVSGDYNRKTGLTGNGSTKFLNSNRNNNADPQNSVSHAVWLSTAGTGGYVPIGAGFNLTGSTRCSPNTTNGATSIRVRTAAPMGLSVTATPTNQSFFGYRRSASNDVVLRMNSVEYARTDASETPFNGNVFVFADNSSGTATAHANGTLAFYSIGESLTLSSLDTRVSALYTAIGAALAPNYADADVNAYINAVETADKQLLETGVRDAINTFITGCKSDGTWTAIKASCILMGAHTLSGALVPLVGSAPTNVNFVGGDYNRKTGLVGNGSTKYLNTNRNNNADPQDSKHVCVYSTAAGGGGISIGCGNLSDTGRTVIARVPAGSVHAARVHNATNSNFGDGAGTGFIGASRSGSASFVARMNGVNATLTQTSETPQNENIGVLGRTTGASYSSERIAFYSIGESLTLSVLDSRLSALYTAIGAAIP